jgi:hypothetical protein
LLAPFACVAVIWPSFTSSNVTERVTSALPFIGETDSFDKVPTDVVRVTSSLVLTVITIFAGSLDVTGEFFCPSDRRSIVKVMFGRSLLPPAPPPPQPDRSPAKPIRPTINRPYIVFMLYIIEFPILLLQEWCWVDTVVIHCTCGKSLTAKCSQSFRRPYISFNTHQIVLQDTWRQENQHFRFGI